MTKNFNSRSREESDGYDCTDYITFKISIHALAKRATSLFAEKFDADNISIHALAKRAT